ncbi:MAG: hypothetical protein EPO16_04145 [Dehalococcoidia bacterium]|nr:MAG: hypothetical protein EPO16_04145 [Dehalococcoidia bacterium]
MPRTIRIALIAVGLSALAVLWAMGLRSYVMNESAPYVVAPELATQAEAVCREMKSQIPEPAPLSASATFEERAQRVEAGAESLQAMIARLRALPGADASYGFRSWLDEYDGLVKIGLDYAIAVRTGDPKKYIPAGNKGDRPQTLLVRDAKFNNMPSCAP